MSELLDEIETCLPALRRYARALTRNTETADDLVQDCLERALRKSALWRPTGAVKSWLFTVMLNIHRNNLRQTRREIQTMAVEDMRCEPSAPEGQSNQMALSDVERALQKLPAQQREVILLVALEGFTYIEAASILQIPKGTLMSRLGRARQNLRTLMGDDRAQPPGARK